MFYATALFFKWLGNRIIGGLTAIFTLWVDVMYFIEGLKRFWVLKIGYHNHCLKIIINKCKLCFPLYFLIREFAMNPKEGCPCKVAIFIAPPSST